MRPRRFVLAGLAACALAPTAARADEPLFGYVNTTDLLPRGKAQVEQWLTGRTGQAGGDYSRIEGRSEAEYGLRDNLQLTGYLNYSSTDAGPSARQRFDGVTAEAIWRLASPYLSPVGVAVLAEATLGEDERAGRVRAIVQKNFRDDTVVLAANAWVELEKRPPLPGSPLRPKATTLEFDAGVSWRFRPGWSAGVEYRHRAEYAGSGLSGPAAYVADYAGPTIHYGARRWFATLSALRQVHGGAAGTVLGTRHTRWDGIRFRLGRTF